MPNPLFSDREIEFQLYEVHGAEDLCRLPAFRDHGRDTFDLFLASARKIAREVLFPAYRPMDAEPPRPAGRRRPGGGGARGAAPGERKEPAPPPVGGERPAARSPAEAGGQELPVLIA